VHLGEQQHGHYYGECDFRGRYGYGHDIESDLYRYKFNYVLIERPNGQCYEVAVVIDQ
jgi:hypothetical protein